VTQAAPCAHRKSTSDVHFDIASLFTHLDARDVQHERHFRHGRTIESDICFASFAAEACRY